MVVVSPSKWYRCKYFLFGEHASMYSKVFIESFWSKVKIGRLDECWIWLGATDRGYGRFWVSKRPTRRRKGSHVVSFEIFHKRQVSVDLCVCHVCDIPLCCNPLHLWEGTRVENNRDMCRKNRQSKTGRVHSPQEIQKRRATLKKIHHQQKELNANFGKIWIMNLFLRKSTMVSPRQLDEKIKEGWKMGRKLHW